MRVIGTGIDIVENSRIKKSLLLKSFLNRIFTQKEISISKKTFLIKVFKFLKVSYFTTFLNSFIKKDLKICRTS